MTRPPAQPQPEEIHRPQHQQAETAQLEHAAERHALPVVRGGPAEFGDC